MPDAVALFAQLKSQISAVADPLFEMSEKQLRSSGNFLPHGAVLTREGEIQLVAADPRGPGEDSTDATEVLPLLHDGLRSQVRKSGGQALGVAENVTITPKGEKPTQAMKVLFEHERGLTMAFYVPFRRRRLFRGVVIGEAFSTLAEPEVNAWGGDTH